MDHRPLGRTGVSVSQLTLGAMMFGAWGDPDHDESVRIIHRALDAGITVIDTADVSSLGESEAIVGKALEGRRDDVVLATKVAMPMGQDPNRRGTSRRWITRAVEDSLRRLGTDRIDLLGERELRGPPLPASGPFQRSRPGSPPSLSRRRGGASAAAGCR